MKCNVCNKEYTTTCDYNQGRCPKHPSLIEVAKFDSYRARYYNLFLTIKKFIVNLGKK
jgi:hypothetical protein